MKISQKKRERIVIQTSMIGIATNLFLSLKQKNREYLKYHP